MSKCHYLRLCHRKIPIFSNNELYRLEKPRFCKQFLQLWQLLYNVGTANGATFSGIIRSFPKPKLPSSNLTGVPFITDPSSVVRLFSFVNANLDGPIVTDGYNLETYNSEVFYEITYTVRNHESFGKSNTHSPKDLIIGFYRSDGFAEDITNTFSLICGDLGPSIFNKGEGSFISPGISNLFVATNQDVIIDLTVRVIIPTKIVYPEITKELSYEKYITITDKHCDKHRVLVYTISQVDDTGTNVIKYPSKYFVEATKVIQDYLLATGLSVTFSSTFVNKSLNSCNSCVSDAGCGFRDIDTREVRNVLISQGNVSMDAGKTCDPQYWVAGVYQGIKLDPPNNKVSRITYEIASFEGNVSLDLVYNILIVIQYKSGLLWFPHSNINNSGNVDGEAAKSIRNTSSDKHITFSGSFRIPETAKAFGITVYYSSPNIPDVSGRLLYSLISNTVFAQVAISYEDKIIV